MDAPLVNRDIQSKVLCHLRGLQNADRVAGDILTADDNFDIKLAIRILAEEMLKEEATEETRGAASTVLLVLANHHFNDVMYELQRNIRTAKLPHRMVFRTLGSLAARYALKSIPFLSLTTMYIWLMLKLPIISPMKEAICYVMEHFCTAINYYYKNWKVCSFPREAESQLCSPLIPIYKRLAGDWMNDEEPQVQEASIRALWPMLGALIRRQEQQEDIVKHVPLLLAMSKNLDSFLVAKRLSFFLDICEECKPPMPKKTFQAVCEFVFKQVLPVDTSSVQPLKKRAKITDIFFSHSWKPQPPQITQQRRIQEEEGPTTRDLQLSREHHEVLMEAFSHLVCCSPMDALDFLQTQMKDDTEYVRVLLLKHLKAIIVSDDTCETRSRKQPIVDAVKCILDDHREAVAKATLAFIKELVRSENVEGCAVWDMVAYVFQHFNQPGVKDCPPSQKEKEDGIQEICIDVLEHLNTSAEGMSKILWPKLLHYVIPAPYSPALRPLCRCLKELAVVQQGESALFLGSCKGVKLPSAQGLLARLLVLASNPNPTGRWALQLLHAMRCNIHTAVNKLWGTQIPLLGESSQGNTGTSSQEWEQKLLKFLRRSLETIADNNWTRNLSCEFESQMSSYADLSAEKRFLYKSLGTSLTSCEDLPFVKSQIQHIAENANYMDASEREKVTHVLSFSAMGHLNLTLGTLHKFGDGLQKKTKVSEVISRYKDYYQGRRGHVHQTLMLTYGRVALCAPKELLCSRVETDIIKRVLQHYYNSGQVLGVTIANKDLNLKLAFIQSMIDISHAIHETQDDQDLELTCKKELLGILLAFIREEPLDSLATPVRPKAIIALGCLSKLKPFLTLEENRDLLDQSIKSVFPLPPLDQLKEEVGKDSVYVESLYDGSVDALGKLMKSILEEEPSPELVDEMFQLIDPWFTETECGRERALHAGFQLLTAFQESIRGRIPSAENFQLFGSLVALLAPFTCDSSPRCRQWAGECLACLLHIQAQAGVTPEEEQEMLSACQDLQSELPRELFKASSRLAKVVSTYFPPGQVLDFIEAILEELVSGNEMCAITAGYWLLTILQDCGSALEVQVSKILDVFYSRLPTIKEESLRQVLMDAISIVANYHLDAVFSSLLCRRLPLDSETGELWRSLGSDLFLSTLILHRLAATVMQPPSSETASASNSDETSVFADEEPLTATCAIYEVMSVLPTGQVIQELFPTLFCALLQQVSKTLGQKMPFSEGRRRLFKREQHLSEGNPCWLSVASLKSLLLKLTSEPSLAETKGLNIWVLLRDPSTHHEGVCLLTSHLVQGGLLDKEIIEHVLSWMNSGSEKLRLTSTAFFVEAMKDPIFSETEQLKTFFPILIERAGDDHCGVRQMAVRGLGNVLLVAPNKVAKEKRTIVAILLDALYDGPVAKESLQVLAVVLPHLKEKTTGPLFKNITIQTLSFLDDEDADLRNAALQLFGVLAASTKSRFHAFFAGQVKRNLAPLLIHQQDPSPQVSEACRVAFLQSVKFLPQRKRRSCTEELRPANPLTLPYLHVYICRQLVKTIPEMRDELLRQTVDYFRSSWEAIRTAALDLAGVILESMQITDLQEPFRLQLLGSLEVLLEDPSCRVQRAAADVATFILKKWGESESKEDYAMPEPAPTCEPQPGTTPAAA